MAEEIPEFHVNPLYLNPSTRFSRAADFARQFSAIIPFREVPSRSSSASFFVLSPHLLSSSPAVPLVDGLSFRFFLAIFHHMLFFF